MPLIGETRRGRDIGLRRQETYRWVGCPMCSKERWVFTWRTEHPDFTGICQKCNGAVARPHASREQHGMWTGGKRTDSRGYISLKLHPDHPYCDMVTARDHYIVEHRLVMAEHLGRLLESWEIVHHINREKHDNRIENLELLPSGAYHKVVHNAIKDSRISTLKAVAEWADREMTKGIKQPYVFIDKMIVVLREGKMPGEEK